MTRREALLAAVALPAASKVTAGAAIDPNRWGGGRTYGGVPTVTWAPGWPYCPRGGSCSDCWNPVTGRAAPTPCGAKAWQAIIAGDDE